MPETAVTTQRPERQCRFHLCGKKYVPRPKKGPVEKYCSDNCRKCAHQLQVRTFLIRRTEMRIRKKLDRRCKICGGKLGRDLHGLAQYCGVQCREKGLAQAIEAQWLRRNQRTEAQRKTRAATRRPAGKADSAGAGPAD